MSAYDQNIVIDLEFNLTEKSVRKSGDGSVAVMRLLDECVYGFRRRQPMNETYFDGINWEEEESKNRPSVRAAAAELVAEGKLSDALHELSWGDARVNPESECGCFYCGAVFPASEVDDWSINPQGGFTALCPRCGIDSVLVAESVEGLGVEFGPELLQQMHETWFEEQAELDKNER